MARLELPDPVPAGTLPFRDVQSARAWLRLQPQVEPLQMQTVLLGVVQALDASDIAAATRVGILEALRGAVILAQSGVESRYTRKPLPLPAAEAKVFTIAKQLWRALAVAYLRTALQQPADSLLPLHRGAVALRLEMYAHFLAAYQVPNELLHLLNGVLGKAEALGIQRAPLADPEFKYLGESHVAGHVAWAFLLQFADPYRLSAVQLAVANRAFSRWRELAGFQTVPEDDPKARAMPLKAILGEDGVVDGGPSWLNVRPVARKIRKRIELLQAGETPEQLKLGRELSSAACIRLLQQLDESLRPDGVREESGGDGKIDLVFGPERCYTALAKQELNPSAQVQDPASRAMSHQRMAVFGFDNLATRADVVKHVELSTETWQVTDGFVWRNPEAGGRLLSPCLVAAPAAAGEPAKLGVLLGLQVTLDGRLQAKVVWHKQRIEAAWFRVETAGAKGQKVPAFVLGGDDGMTLILPAAAGARLGSRVFLEDAGIQLVVLGEVLERGSDFVRYAIEQQ